MTDIRPLSFEELCDQLEQPCPTLVLLHRNPDADAVGSAFALKQVLEDLGSTAHCMCCDELPPHLAFLAEGMQESILPESLPESFLPQRIITVDTATTALLGSLAEIYEGQVDLMLDHHASAIPYANHYIADAAATGELMFDIVKHFAQREAVEITELLCTNLYAAISGDTGGFRFANVTPETHIRAAELVASGIDTEAINRALFDSRSMEQLRAMAAGISNLHLSHNGSVAVILFPYALKAALGLEEHDLDKLIDVARSLAGVRIAIVIRQPSTEAVFRASVRSSCDYDVSELCGLFGGGGHTRAAACTIHASDAEEAMEKLVGQINFSEWN